MGATGGDGARDFGQRERSRGWQDGRLFKQDGR